MLEFLGHPLKENGNWFVTVPLRLLLMAPKAGIIVFVL
jgi:hypothetical protein